MLYHKEVSYNFMKDFFITDWHFLSSGGPGTPLSSKQTFQFLNSTAFITYFQHCRTAAQKSCSFLRGYIAEKTAIELRWVNEYLIRFFLHTHSIKLYWAEIVVSTIMFSYRQQFFLPPKLWNDINYCIFRTTTNVRKCMKGKWCWKK